MNKDDRIIFQNASVLTLTEVLARALGLFLMMMVARKLGPAIVGIYTFAVAFIMLFEIFVGFGLDTFVQREVSRFPQSAPSLLLHALTLKLGIYILCLLVIVALIPFIAAESLKTKVVLLLALAMFFRSNVSVICYFFRASQLSHLEAQVRIGFRLMYTVSGILVILSGYGLVVLVSLECLAWVAAFFLAWRIFQKKIGVAKGLPSFTKVIQLARSTWNFFIVRVVQTVFNSIDLVMLSIMSGDLFTGYYGVAVKLVGTFSFLPNAFTGAFLPVLSRSSLNDPTEFSRVFEAYFKYMFLIGAGLGAVIAALPEQLILLLFGQDFIPAAPTLALMAIALIITFGNWPLSMAIIALDKERQIARIFAVCAGVNILLNLWLIPSLKDQGAAWATIFSQILLAGFQLRLVGRRFHTLNLGILSLRPIVAALLTWGLVRMMAIYNIELVWNLISAFIAFVSFGLLTGALRSRDLLTAKAFLVRRSSAA